MIKFENNKLVIDGEEIDEAELKSHFKAQGIKTKPHTFEAQK